MTSSTRRTERAVWTAELLEPRTLLAGTPTLGPEVLLAGDAQPVASAGKQQDVQIAAGLDEGGNPVSLAVWTDYRTAVNEPPSAGSMYFGEHLGQLTDIYAARIDAGGNVIGKSFVINQGEFYQHDPVVGWNGSNWLVSWLGERQGDRYFTDLQAVRVSPAGAVLDAAPIVIDRPEALPAYPEPYAVGSNGDEWVVLYRTGVAGAPHLNGVSAARLGADGTVLNPGGTQLVAAQNYFATLDIDYLPAGQTGGQYLVSWDVSAPIGSYGQRGRVQRFDAQMNPLGGAIPIDPAELDSHDVRVANDGARWGVAWAEDDHTWFRTVSADGTLGDKQFVQDGWEGIWYSPDVAYNGDGFTVARDNWNPGTGGGAGNHLHVTAWHVSPGVFVGVGVDIGAPEAGIRPRLARVGGNVQVVYEARPDAGGTFIGGVSIAPGALAGPHTPVGVASHRQIGIDLASNGAGFLAVWRDDANAASRAVAQRLDSGGVAIDPEPVALGAIGALENAAVAFNGSIYLATWSFENRILARRLDATGQPIDAQPFFVMNGNEAAVAALGATFLIACTIEPVNHIRYVDLARVGADGAVIDATPIRVNNSFSRNVDVIAAGDRWLVTWEDDASHDNPGSDVEVAFVAADGTVTFMAPLDIPGGADDDPAAAFDGTHALIVWSGAQDIYGRLLDPATGAYAGAAFVINAQPRRQYEPSAAFDGTEYAVAWTDQRHFGPPRQDHDDVFTTRVSAAGAVTDPIGVPLSDTALPEMSPAVGAAGTDVVYAYSKLINAPQHGTLRIVTRSTSSIDSIPPRVTDSGFAYQTGQWAHVRFSENVGASVEALDLRVVWLTTGSQRVAESVVYDAATNTARFMFDAPLSDGRYRATLPAGSVADASGNTLSIDHTFEFFFLQADANHDGRVNLDDFNILAANFGQSGRDFTQGDFNYDGQTNLSDFNILVGRFGNVLAAASTAGTAGGSQLDNSADDDDKDSLSDLLA